MASRLQRSTSCPKRFSQTTKELAAARKKLTPHIHDAFTAFSDRVFADGALPTKTKQLIAVAAAHVTQCPYCIRGHTKAALRHGALCTYQRAIRHPSATPMGSVNIHRCSTMCAAVDFEGT